MSSRAAAYPIDPWRIRETRFDPSMVARGETIFSLGNGHLGMRGNFEEGSPTAAHGTYINGFYEETPIVYGEIAFGYAKNRQVMLNVADGKRITLLVGGEPFDLARGTLIEYERTLDLAGGILLRAVRWRSPAGREVTLRVRRLVSLSRPHVAAIEWTVAAADAGTPLVIESSIEGAVANRSSTDDPRVGARFPHCPLSVTHSEAAGMRGALAQETRNTRFAMACAMENSLDAPGCREGAAAATARNDASAGPERAAVRIALTSAPNGVVRLSKYLAYVDSLELPRDGLLARARDEAARAGEAGFEALAAEQRERMELYWQDADVEVDGDEALQQGLRFNLFSLFQSAGRDGRTSMAAKGLTGQGYEGHYFWDTETYGIPFFAYTRPEIARALVTFRCGTLDKARRRAREMSQRGALFPWRTIGGEEASAYYPAGTAQYHIDADIVHAMRLYVEAAADEELLREAGAELVFETARLWADLGSCIPRRNGAFCINEVTGPDEYTALVDNDLYTNLMARENLEYAADVAEELKSRHPDDWGRVSGRIGLTEGEIDAWRQAARLMRIPYDRELGIHCQDDSFLDRAPWDLAATPAEMHPLLLHYHPLVIYRRQVLKQPAVVLAQVLLGHRFSMAEKKRNFDFYNPLTTGDSSLSPCIQSVAAAELGYADMAYDYFTRTARMDLDDVNGNSADGAHMAAMAGTWMSVVRGFAGMRDHGGRLSFSPRLPRQWRSLRFRLRFRGRRIEVAVTRETASYLLREGEPMAILHEGEELRMTPGQAVTVSSAPRLRCVIFDLDGVLTDTTELHYQAWKRLADERGIPFNRAVNERLKGVGRRESLKTILSSAGVRVDESEEERLTDRKNSYYRELLRTLTPAHILPGIMELLAGLRSRGIRTAIASVSRNAPQIVEQLGIGGLMDFIADAAAVVKGKPDPEIFMTAAERLGVPFACCAGVEDARVGIQAIKATGMFAVGIGADLPGSDWLLPDTRGLGVEELINRFNAKT